MQNIRLLVKRQSRGFTFESGMCLKAIINEDGTATTWWSPHFTFEPDEYELVIPDRAYEDLLKV